MKTCNSDNEIIAAIMRGVRRIIEVECGVHQYITPEQKDLIARTALAIRDELIKS